MLASFILCGLLLGFVQPVLAAENPIQKIQQRIQALLQQISDLFRQFALETKKIAEEKAPLDSSDMYLSQKNTAKADIQTEAKPKSDFQNTAQIQTRNRIESSTQSGVASSANPAILTVKASGVTPKVSINGGSEFDYSGPITLNDGDTYLVTASVLNSTTKCKGTASPGGTYSCNINMQGQ